jgi:hypothetical protein
MENKNEIPMGPDGKDKKKFEIKTNGKEKAIFINGEIFDWKADPKSISDAMRMGPEYMKAAQKDIQKHFLDSLSEIVGRQLTAIDIARASKEGWI